MGLNESDTRAKLIDPALHARGWTEDLIRREETAGAVEIIGGKPHRRAHGRVDYTLRMAVAPGAQPVAVALIEAKAEGRPPTHGLEQGKCYADARRMNVPFVFASNGRLFVEYDRFTGRTGAPQPLTLFPTPNELRARYEQGMGFSLDAEAARPLLARYKGGEVARRYYQDAAIRAVLERIARGERRSLLSLATGAGKTFIAVNLLRRIADAGQLRRALFVCDRDELRGQGLAAFQAAFGADAAAASARNPEKNARVVVATYQTLGIDAGHPSPPTPLRTAGEGSDGGHVPGSGKESSGDSTATFLVANYPENYFSHIIIDECHRSAWGAWSQVLTRNPDAVQIGLTATPRQLRVREGAEDVEDRDDRRVTEDNVRYFGEPVYEYDMGHGIEDGYLAACEIVRRDIFLDRKPEDERATGLAGADLVGKTLTDARTGELLSVADARARYDANAFEARLVLPERVQAMAEDLFAQLLATGGPEQKTIVFCARDEHADRVAAALNNLYADWCHAHGHPRQEPYAFKCTAASNGADSIADLRGSARHHFIAATVDLLTTGVDVPSVRNIVFFKYVNSPISFYQMVGRGTRIDPVTGKLMFRVYDYTNATRLFGQGFVTAPAALVAPEEGGDGPREHTIQVAGVTVHVTDAGRYILTTVDGRTMPMTVEEYAERLAARLVAEAPTLDAFRGLWVTKDARQGLLGQLPEAGRSCIWQIHSGSPALLIQPG